MTRRTILAGPVTNTTQSHLDISDGGVHLGNLKAVFVYSIPIYRYVYGDRVPNWHWHHKKK